MTVTNFLAKTIPSMYSSLREGNYGITEADTNLARRHGLSAGGLGDVTFPWHFAAGVASSVVDVFADNGNIPVNEAKNMTLTDWAGIIGTGWFSDICHSLAFARNGLYNSFGSNFLDYQHNGFTKHLSGEIKDFPTNLSLFEVAARQEPEDGYTYLAAAAAPDLLKITRATMDRSRSAGCPVARHATALFPAMLTDDPHTKNLIDTKRLHIKEDTGQSDKVIATQDYSAIDYSLMVLAAKLEHYDVLYGTPRVLRRHDTRSLYTLHESRPSSAIAYLRSETIYSDRAIA